ncbi:methyltransferase domain-containing protein [Oceanospirillaceae bacterium]|nr:methyltransferase domain-containing protein [bacterium]MDB4214347.1 methyltransferase domain-containing protein [Oceanospirillaceae bacterium]
MSLQAQLLVSYLNVSVYDLVLRSLPFADDHFDVFYSKFFLGHLRDPSEFMKAAYRVLKPSGIIVSMVPDWGTVVKKFYDYDTSVSPVTIISLKKILLIIGFENVKVYKDKQLLVVW